MTFTLTALLAVFFILAITSGVYFLALRLRLPYTVLLVAVGALVLVPLSGTTLFSFLRDFFFTPELLFYVFLPIIIFESAYNINIKRLRENIWAVGALSVVSLLLSVGIIAVALYYLLPYVGITIPFILCVLFGSLISATDPVAVLALFKEYGAPRRLTLLFEGESIFNDGTAVAVFLILLGIAAHGYDGFSSVVDGVGMFVMMVVGGVLFGAVIGITCALGIGAARKSEFVQITLMLVMAHLTFILTEFISQKLVLFGQNVHLSAIIATAVASIILGNYGRAKITPHAEEFIDKFWMQSAFLSNSVIFILIGLIFSTIPIQIEALLLPILIAVIVVAIARAVSIYPVTSALNAWSREDTIPRAWQHLLAWGSLRGALAVTMVLLIPDNLMIQGWSYAFTPKDFVLGLTIGCIFATLFIKATTIRWVMQKLGVSALTDIEVLELEESRALVHERVLEKLDTLCERGHVSEEVMDRLRAEHHRRLDDSSAACCSKLSDTEQGHVAIGERVLRMYAIGLEREALQSIYEYGEVNERVYRKILAKLELQYDQYDMPEGIEHEHSTVALRLVKYTLVDKVCAWFDPGHRPLTVQDRYMQYRAQTVLSRAVIDIFARMSEKSTQGIFGAHAFEHVHKTYTDFLSGSTKKMRDIVAEDPVACEQEAERIARHSILGVEERALEEFANRRMITPKVHAILRAELAAEADRLSDIDDQRTALADMLS